MEGNGICKGKGLKGLFRLYKPSMSVTVDADVCIRAPGTEGSGWGGRQIG